MNKLTLRSAIPGSVLVATALLLGACGSSSSSSSSPSTASSGTSGGSSGTSAAAGSNGASGATGGNVAPVANSGPNTPAPHPLPTMTSVTITVPAKVESFAAPIVAIQKGEFKKENLNVTLKLDPGGAASEPQELGQGTVQLTETGLNAGALNAMSQGVGLRYVGYPYTYQNGDKEGFWVNKNYVNPDGSFNKSKVSSFKISLGTAGIASSSALQVQQWLQKSGVSLSQVSVTNLAGPAMVTALQNGGIQGAYALSPFYAPLLTDPKFEQVTGTPLAVGVFEMSTSFIQQKPQVAEAIMRALIRTDRTWLGPNYRSEPDVMSIIAAWLGVPAATIDKNPAVVFSTDLSTEPLSTLVPEIQQMWISLGVLQYKRPLTINQVIDPSVVTAVLAGSGSSTSTSAG